MEKPIMHLEFMLSRPSDEATLADAAVARDLADTLRAHANECVGMAANMIGERKRIIVFFDEGSVRTMYNPRIVAKAGEYRAKEGCLSLAGERWANRFRKITVDYDDESFTHRTEAFEGFTAQIIQHEIDHCNGVLI